MDGDPGAVLELLVRHVVIVALQLDVAVGDELDKLEGSRADRLELEITETVMLQDTGATLATLHNLRGLGVHIALDDFGTGYSSINYLQRHVIDKLKIDRSFVKTLGGSDGSSAIVRAIVELARAMRMKVTAEGVETAEDFERMRELGCDTIQGYLFGRPLSYDRANQMVTGLTARKLAG